MPPNPNIQLNKPNVSIHLLNTALKMNSKIQNIPMTSERQTGRIFCGKISMLTMYGIGARPKQAEKTMHAMHSGGIHVYPNALMSKNPYAPNIKYATAVNIDEQM